MSCLEIFRINYLLFLLLNIFTMIVAATLRTFVIILYIFYVRREIIKFKLYGEIVLL